MTTIVTRAGKGSPLTNNEVDANFTNLNTAKIETLTSTDTSVTITGTGDSRDLSINLAVVGNVDGPASSTDNAVARFDGTTGHLIQNSTAATIDDSGNADFLSQKADFFDIDTAATTSAAVGRIRWDATKGTALLGETGGNLEAAIGQTLDAYVTNAEAITITKGQAVYLFSAQGDRASVKLAYNTGDATSAKTFGIAAENITANGIGLIRCVGVLDGLNLGSYTAGDTLYLGATAGTLTATKPAAPNHLVYIGVVERANSGNGQLYIRVQNGYELNEIHDVSVPSPTDGQPLVYEASTDLWKNKTLPVIGGGTGATVANGAMANLMGFTSTATAAGTTTLTNTSSYYQIFTGSTTETIVLPVTSTLQTGWTFHICNNSTGALTVNSSGGNLVISVIAGTTVMVTCIGTTLTTAADWEAGYTDFSTATGTGAVVLATSPSVTGLTATGSLALNGSGATNGNFHISATTGATTLGGTGQTGNMTVGRSTASQTTNIQAGATASGSTKTMNIGTGGLSGSTTAIAIGSDVSGATSNVTVNGLTTFAGTYPGVFPEVVAISGSFGSSASGANSFNSRPDVPVGTGLSDLFHFSASPPSSFGGTSVNQYGFFASQTLTGASSNYGFYGNIDAASSCWNFYAAGTADNYFAGNVGIGTSSPGYKLDIQSGTAAVNIQSTTSTNNSYINFRNVGFNYVGIESSTGGSLFTGTAPYSAVFGTVSSYPVAFATSGIERMRITSNGGVSFGTGGTNYGVQNAALISNGDAPPTYSQVASLGSFFYQTAFMGGF